SLLSATRTVCSARAAASRPQTDRVTGLLATRGGLSPRTCLAAKQTTCQPCSQALGARPRRIVRIGVVLRRVLIIAVEHEAQDFRLLCHVQRFFDELSRLFVGG